MQTLLFFINSKEVKIKSYDKLSKSLIKKIEEEFNLKFVRFSFYRINKVVNDNFYSEDFKQKNKIVEI